MNDIGKSARCWFRQLDQQDAELLLALDTDPAVMKYINGGVPASRESIEQVSIPRLLAYHNPERGWGLWGVFLTADDRFIGWVLARPMHFFSDQPRLHELELGWRFLREYWGQGYATEAARHLMHHLQLSGYRHFSAIALPDNQGSIAIMKKIGMTFVARELHKDPLGDAVVDYYSMTLED